MLGALPGAIPPLRERVTSPRGFDVLVAVALGALAQVEAWLTAAGDGQRVLTSVTAAVMCAALAWRRTSPLAATGAAIGAVGVLGTIGTLPIAVFLLPVTLIALYSVGAYSTVEHAAVGLALALVILGVTTARDPEATVTDLTAPAALFTGAWGVGRLARSRGAETMAAERRAARLQAEQRSREQAAVAAERARIARELHDIVAHRVTTIVIQAEAGAASSDEADGARDAFAAIGDSGRQALVELRRMLGLLRSDDVATDVAPQPGLGRLGALLDEVGRAGLGITADIDEDLPAMSPGLGLAAYRVLQEGLTNALRHGGTTAHVRARSDGRVLRLEIRNPLGDAPPRTDGAGQGLVGMRERIRLFGGDLAAGPAGGEFVLAATLPLEDGAG